MVHGTDKIPLSHNTWLLCGSCGVTSGTSVRDSSQNWSLSPQGTMLLIIEQITRLCSFMFLCAEIQYKSFMVSDPKPIWFCGLWIRLAASNSHTPPIRQLHERQVTTRRDFLHNFRELGVRKENLPVQISSLVGVFSPGAEPVPWLAPWHRICLMYFQEGQGLLLENVTFDCFFLSGNHSEDDPSSHLLIPVSGRKEKPELCGNHGAPERAWCGECWEALWSCPALGRGAGWDHSPRATLGTPSGVFTHTADVLPV